MAFATIDKGNKYFNTVLFSGNSGTQSITGVGFKPDWVWNRQRSSGGNSRMFDAVRGTSLALISNDTAAEASQAGVSSFDTDGFTTGSINNSTGQTYVTWNWLAANSTASNTSGTITSTVSANTTSGFSVVSYTGNGSSSATVGHGLGLTPAMIIIKNRSAASQWMVKHKSLATDYNLQLNVTDAQVYLPSGTGQGGVGNLSSSSTFGFTSGTTGVNNVNNSGSSFIAYCFAEVKGYSKFSSFTGNGSTDGTFVYTGFKPSFVMIKGSSNAGTGWYIYDSTRNTYNPERLALFADGVDAETDYTSSLDFVSNGFKLKTVSTGLNGSGYSYVYMCFAQNPFVSSKGIPCTAR